MLAFRIVGRKLLCVWILLLQLLRTPLPPRGTARLHNDVAFQRSCDPREPRILALGSLRRPVGFLHAFVFDACINAGLDVTQDRARLSVIPPSEAQTLPDLHGESAATGSSSLLADGIYLVGLTLEGGSLNPTTGMTEWAGVDSPFSMPSDVSRSIPPQKPIKEKTANAIVDMLCRETKQKAAVLGRVIQGGKRRLANGAIFLCVRYSVA